jgi:tetratricopeptide (TPR) repeat protein
MGRRSGPFIEGDLRMSRTSVAFLSRLLCLLIAVLGAGAMAHDARSPTARPVRVLGTIDFPTSAQSPEAQQAFVRGMLLLHLFEYPFARDEFVEAQRIEPRFAMAYWGEAMTYDHPIWDQQDAAAARAALRKLAPTAAARSTLAPTPREKAFLASLDVLYGEGSKQARDRAYARAMEQMASDFPDDHEVQLFHALALMGEHAGVRDVPSYMQAAAIAQSVFCANPHHPGAAHYLIHAVDDPVHAVLGLQAARALEKMAPDAGHSLHMASHIFNALGMWDDVVRANEASTAVQNRMHVERGEKPGSWGHANFWLLYGYLQQGRFERARNLLEAAYREARAENKPPKNPLELDPDESQASSVVQMWTRYLVETGDWSGEIAGWTFNIGDAFDPNLNVLFVRSLSAANTGRPAQADGYLNDFRHMRTELEKAVQAQAETKPTDALYLQRLAVLDQEMQAQISRARGDDRAAVEHAREASRLEGEMPYSFGPPFIDWPAAEMLAQLLYDAHSYAAANAAFDTQLERAHLRSASLLGVARSARKLGHDPEADRALARLRSNWRQADPQVMKRIAGVEPATP